MIDLSLVVPAYNEAANLKKLIEKLNTLSAPNIEIIIVDNGSDDNTEEVFHAILLKNKNIKLVRKPENTGYGAGILFGLALAKGNVFAWTHADLQTNPADVLQAYEIYQNAQNEFLLVKGSRLRRFGLSVLLSKSMQTFASLVLGYRFNEINAQPKLFSKTAVQEFLKTQPPQDFALDLAIIHFFLKHDYALAEFPVKFDARFAGKAKGGGSNIITIAKISIRSIKFILRLKEK